MDARLPRTPATPPAFGRSLALSLGLHGAAFGAALFVAFGPRAGLRTGGPAAIVRVAEAELESEWTLEAAPDSPAAELEPPTLPAPELVPVDAPADAPVPRLVPDEATLAAPLFDWSTALADARPLARIERRPQVVESAPIAAAELSTAAPAPRGEDRPLRLVEGPAPAYPRVALRLQQQGNVLLELEVDVAGHVAAVRVLESSGFERLDEAAREGVLAWRFEPALRDGTPVPERFRHRIQFVLEW